MGAAVVAVLSELDAIFTVREQRMALKGTNRKPGAVAGLLECDSPIIFLFLEWGLPLSKCSLWALYQMDG